MRLSERSAGERDLENKKFAMKHMIRFDEYVGDYDLSIAIGGQMHIQCDLDELCAEYFRPESDMMMLKHPWRDCIYREAAACKDAGKDDAGRIEAHMKRYREAGYPEHNGLYATGIVGRRHDRENVKAMCRLWFEELRRGSMRDQLSLNYALWRSPPIDISPIDWERFFKRRKITLHSHL